VAGASTNPIWWVFPGLLGGMPAPFIDSRRREMDAPLAERYGDELQDLMALGVRSLVNLVDHGEDGAIYRAAGFEFLALPVGNGSPPTIGQWREFCRFVDAQLLARRPVVVFCAAGLGRTGTLLASYLIHCGDPASAAIARIRGVEPAAIETNRQMTFLYDLEKLPRLGLMPGKVRPTAVESSDRPGNSSPPPSSSS
jgi:atypical dual specificity phosphatase